MASPFNASDADLSLRTSDGTTFRVYSSILAVASPFFHDMLKLSQPDAGKDTSMAVVDVSETSKVMDILLRFIYPIEELPIGTLSLLSDVLAAAIKYDAKSALQRLERLLVDKFVKEEPFGVYAIACRLGLDEAAKVASSYTLGTDILHPPLPENLKFITAYDYSRLIVLHVTRGQAAHKVLVWDPTNNIRCPRCHQSGIPLWWYGWSVRAKAELFMRPSTDVVFSLPFLAESREACKTCQCGIMEWHVFLAKLKRQIDGLPNTI